MAGNQCTQTHNSTSPLLNKIPTAYRGCVNNQFLKGARAGLEPTYIVSEVCAWLETRQENPIYSDILRIITTHRYEARVLAEAACRYIRLPDPDRMEHKRQQASIAIDEWMAGKEVTEKQRAMLAGLGHQGEVSDRLEASQIITELMDAKGGR